MSKKIFIYIFLILYLLWVLVPYYFLIIISLMTHSDLISMPPKLFITNIYLNRYIKLFTGQGEVHSLVPGIENVLPGFWNALGNSLIFSFSSVIINILFGSTISYSIARLHFMEKRLLSLVLLGQIVISIGLMIPLYIMLSNLKLINTWIGIILTNSSHLLPFTIWVLTNFFKEIPVEIEEAAIIDGCDKIRMLYTIILPLSGPGLIAVGISVFIYSWGNLMIPLILTSKKELTTLPLFIANLTGHYAKDFALMATIGSLTALPPVLLAFFLQKYMVKGLTAGAIKG